jgi:ornithine cyclodeaminase/alanine dehydrogenase-like protein (mu-crystallin family)
MRILHDEHVRQLAPWVAVDAARRGLLAAHAGRLTSPPRLRAEAGATDYVFTVGGLRDGVSGFRAYRTCPHAGDQLVAVWNHDGELAGVVVGAELGARRTGALGAVAADVLARRPASVLATIGTGPQAWAQVWAITAVRTLAHVHVFSRDPERRAGFARRVGDELGVPAAPAPSAEQAAAGADIVILATTSTSPVLDAAAIRPGTHLTTVGPKWAGAHELPLDLAEKAAVITCDSPQQAAHYPRRFFVDPAALTALGAVVAGEEPGRTAAADITVHCSVGLAGTEVLLGARLLGLGP